MKMPVFSFEKWIFFSQECFIESVRVNYHNKWGGYTVPQDWLDQQTQSGDI